MKKHLLVSLRTVLAAPLGLALCAVTAIAGSHPQSNPAPGAAPSVRVDCPADSGGPIQLPGIELDNFGVVDGRIFRGEQPGKSDYLSLAAIGITTIIDLRLDAKGDARKRAEDAGLKYINIPIDGHGTPTDDDASAFLKAVDDPANGTVYVHCAGGRHRTGSMIAVYRMVQNGWSIDQAYQEMLAYDFYTKRGHKGFKIYVEDFYKRLRENPLKVPAYVRATAPSTVSAAAAAAALLVQ